MSNRPHSARAYLPRHLEVPTVGNLMLDEVGYIPQDGVIAYPTPEGQELYVDSWRMTEHARSIRTGHIAVMHCLGWSGEIGLVADLRFVIDPRNFIYAEQHEWPEEVLEGDVTLDEWRRRRQEIPISAYVSRTPDAERIIGGDRDFHAIAAELGDLVDRQLHDAQRGQAFPSWHVRARTYGYVANSAYVLSGV